MRIFFAMFLCFGVTLISSQAQVTSGSVYTIDNTSSGAMLFPAGTYFNNFNTAITALNATTADIINSTVTFNVIAGQIFNESPLKITYANSNTAHPNIIFQKSGAGNNPVILCVGTGIFDTILVIRCGDYYIIDGIDFKNNPSNTSGSTKMECGIALRAGASNGCRNNIIKNCRITLDKTNSLNTVCIHTKGYYAVNQTASNDSNSFTSNTLSNAMNGYILEGASPGNQSDTGNVINQSGGRSYIYNLGPISANSTITTYNGISLFHQTGFTISNTCIDSITHYNNSGQMGTIQGIYLDNNTLNGIIYSDTLQNFGKVGGTGVPQIFGCRSIIAGGNLVFDHNVFQNWKGGSITGLGGGTASVISNNIFKNFIHLTASTSIRGINMWAPVITGNEISFFTGGTGKLYGILLYGGVKILQNNSIHDLSAPGIVSGVDINGNQISDSNFISDNKIYALYSDSLIVGMSIGTLTISNYNIFNNFIYNLNSTSTTDSVVGLKFFSFAGANNIYNNMIYDIRCNAVNVPFLFGGGVQGMAIVAGGGQLKIYFNTIYLNGISISPNHSSACLFINSSAAMNDTIDIRNNILFNNYDVTTGAKAVALWFNDSTSIDAIDPVSNNNLVYAGTPSPKHLLFYDGYHAAQLLGTPTTPGTYKYFLSANNTSPCESNSVTGDPLFVSPAGIIDVHLLPWCSPVSGAGINIPNYSDDIDGDVRPTGGINPDIGADEINSIFLLPGNASAISGTAGVCPGQSGIVFSVPPINNASGYNWVLPNGATIVSGANSGSIVVDFSLTATSGNITVNGTNNCGNGNTSLLFIVTVHPVPVLTTSATDVLCYESCDGSVSVSASGGNPFTYQWDNGQTTATMTNLCENIYFVTVTDVFGCTAMEAPIVYEPTVLTVTDTSTNASCFGCNDGTASINITGGTPPYIYNWNNGATTQSINNLPAGNYSVCATDANGCSVCDTINISEPSGIFSTPENSEIEIYPVPNGGLFSIKVNGKMYFGPVEIFSTTGIKVFSENFCSGYVNVLELKSVVKQEYILQIIVDGKIVRNKMTVM